MRSIQKTTIIAAVAIAVLGTGMASASPETIEQLQNKIFNLQNENRLLQQTIDLFEIELSAVAGDLAIAEAENSILQEKLDKSKENNKTLEKEKKKLKNTIKEIRDKKNTWKDAANSDEIDRLKAELATMNAKLKEMESQLSEPTEKERIIQAIQEIKANINQTTGEYTKAHALIKFASCGTDHILGVQCLDPLPESCYDNPSFTQPEVKLCYGWTAWYNSETDEHESDSFAHEYYGANQTIAQTGKVSWQGTYGGWFELTNELGYVDREWIYSDGRDFVKQFDTPGVYQWQVLGSSNHVEFVHASGFITVIPTANATLPYATVDKKYIDDVQKALNANYTAEAGLESITYNIKSVEYCHDTPNLMCLQTIDHDNVIQVGQPVTWILDGLSWYNGGRQGTVVVTFNNDDWERLNMYSNETPRGGPVEITWQFTETGYYPWYIENHPYVQGIIKVVPANQFN